MKFIDAVEPLLGINIDLPDQVQAIMEKEEKLVNMQANTKQLKDWLLAMRQA